MTRDRLAQAAQDLQQHLHARLLHPEPRKPDTRLLALLDAGDRERAGQLSIYDMTTTQEDET